MAQNELFRRYLEAGMQFSQMTRDRAEAIGSRDRTEGGSETSTVNGKTVNGRTVNGHCVRLRPTVYRSPSYR